MTTAERFLCKYVVDVNTRCWLWTACAGRKGYGLFHDGATKRLVPAHRWSYEHHVGPIPDGLQLDHLCRVPRCVNPEHLEPVTAQVNVVRGVAPTVARDRQASKTHCPQGHPYDAANTYSRTRPDGRPNRVCRTCKNERARAERVATHGPRRRPGPKVPANLKLTPDALALARELVAAGSSIRAAAREVGVSHTQLGARLRTT